MKTIGPISDDDTKEEDERKILVYRFVLVCGPFKKLNLEGH